VPKRKDGTMARIRASRIGAALVLAGICAAAAPAATAADDVAGTWAFVMDTPGGTRTADATFKMDGENVTGTWGEEKSAVKGTFTDGVLALSFPIQSENGPGTLGIKARLVNDALTGEWTFQEYNGTLKATRAAAAR
jgi:hypothetical protein